MFSPLPVCRYKGQTGLSLSLQVLFPFTFFIFPQYMRFPYSLLLYFTYFFLLSSRSRQHHADKEIQPEDHGCQHKSASGAELYPRSLVCTDSAHHQYERGRDPSDDPCEFLAVCYACYYISHFYLSFSFVVLFFFFF